MANPEGGTTLDLPTAGYHRPEPPRGAARPIPALTILAHPALARVGDRAFLGELARGRPVLLSRQEPRFAVPGAPPGSPAGQPLADPFLSRSPLRLEPTPDGGVRLWRDGSPIPLSVDGEPAEDGVKVPSAALDEGVLLDLAGRVALLLHRRPPPASPVPERFGLVGESAALEAVRQAVARVAPLSVPVLVRGETGTGKELVARALHEHGPRPAGPFVGFNLGAVLPTLAAAELFGSVRGAYTGSVRDNPGVFARAEGGTLLLDEIGAAPAELQVLLLRALETGEVAPVGGGAPRRADLRIVSATDADLEAAIAAGTFRAPLLHRLAGYTLRLPPLRERREDVGRLLVHFLRRELERLGGAPPPDGPGVAVPWLPAPLVVRLARYPWPGNVRQLQNAARQLVIDGRGRPSLEAGPGLEELLAASLTAASSGSATVPAVPPAPEAPPPPAEPAAGSPAVPRRRPSQVGEDEMFEALRAHRWNLKAAAAALGIARTSLYAMLDRSPRVRPAAAVPPEEVRGAFERCGGDVEAMAAELEVSERALRQRLRDLGLR